MVECHDGCDGDDSPDGVDGDDGPDGVDGFDGCDGDDGGLGFDGVNGFDGFDGFGGMSAQGGNGVEVPWCLVATSGDEWWRRWVSGADTDNVWWKSLCVPSGEGDMHNCSLMFLRTGSRFAVLFVHVVERILRQFLYSLFGFQTVGRPEGAALDCAFEQQRETEKKLTEHLKVKVRHQSDTGSHGPNGELFKFISEDSRRAIRERHVALIR